MKKVIIPMMLGFGVTLALVIGQRLTTDAMAVVLGVAVGVAASVPTSVLLMALLRRATREASWQADPPSARPDMRAYALPAPQAPPQVIVIDPAAYARQAFQQGYPLPPPALADGGATLGGLRPRRVIGLEEE